MKRLGALIVSMCHIFADRLAKLLVGGCFEGMGSGDIGIQD
jgi:hypothetical protein